jgi:hypothetical protein
MTELDECIECIDRICTLVDEVAGEREGMHGAEKELQIARRIT